LEPNRLDIELTRLRNKLTVGLSINLQNKSDAIMEIGKEIRNKILGLELKLNP
jgi:hypothetical protein